jgi:type II secretory pathway pseudopilin PulG
MKTKFKQNTLNERGTTLVELIVTFALISIFAVGMMMVLSNAITVYTQMETYQRQIQVADTVLDKIEGELERAQVMGTSEEDVSICILNSNQVIFFDPDQRKVSLDCENGGLHILYEDKNQEGSSCVFAFEPEVYMGFEIKELSFSLNDTKEYEKNIICVKITLCHDVYGTFETVRYVKCYNFTTEQDYSTIIEKVE